MFLKWMQWMASLSPRTARVLLGWAIMFLGIGTGGGLFITPPDAYQGEYVRLMYSHVPASWGALGIYTVMALLSGWALVKRLPSVHLWVKALAPVGAILTVLSLLTGALWGKPTWGTWWVWDARLTSMLLLFFLYMAYMQVTDREEETFLKAGAFIVVLGWVNVPIIKWSVEWWTTLHQPATFLKLSRPSIPWSMAWPLVFMLLGIVFYTLAVASIRFSYLSRRRRLWNISRQPSATEERNGA